MVVVVANALSIVPHARITPEPPSPAMSPPLLPLGPPNDLVHWMELEDDTLETNALQVPPPPTTGSVEMLLHSYPDRKRDPSALTIMERIPSSLAPPNWCPMYGPVGTVVVVVLVEVVVAVVCRVRTHVNFDDPLAHQSVGAYRIFFVFLSTHTVIDDDSVPGMVHVINNFDPHEPVTE